MPCCWTASIGDGFAFSSTSVSRGSYNPKRLLSPVPGSNFGSWNSGIALPHKPSFVTFSMCGIWMENHLFGTRDSRALVRREWCNAITRAGWMRHRDSVSYSWLQSIPLLSPNRTRLPGRTHEGRHPKTHGERKEESIIVVPFFTCFFSSAVSTVRFLTTSSPLRFSFRSPIYTPPQSTSWHQTKKLLLSVVGFRDLG